MMSFIVWVPTMTLIYLIYIIFLGIEVGYVDMLIRASSGMISALVPIICLVRIIKYYKEVSKINLAFKYLTD